ncbi:hypothetical protein GIB67_004621 [Kingdonia uniflora]|uniref:E2 ubiquitin-conjugating enzyme n=1 Tax=Kingdonia uniflora TaxID=39325 RepID=A0A7J7MD91_9MAGN|nr:hypothetical protein GIB67_004621 [Kingdonia uniflora]
MGICWSSDSKKIKHGEDVMPRGFKGPVPNTTNDSKDTAPVNLDSSEKFELLPESESTDELNGKSLSTDDDKVLSNVGPSNNNLHGQFNYVEVPTPTVVETLDPCSDGNARSLSVSTTNDLEYGMNEKEEDEVLKNFKLFKKFDTVVDFSDHHFMSEGAHTPYLPTKNWTKSIQQEWKILEENLTDMIFVRVSEERMDLLRAAIIGAEGTPYHDGLFFFDVFFPPDYPYIPPHFEDLVAGYFRERAQGILLACKAYIEGAPVGSLVRGVVHKSSKGGKSGSFNIKISAGKKLPSYVKPINLKKDLDDVIRCLLPAFIQNGAKDCDQFTPLEDINDVLSEDFMGMTSSSTSEFSKTDPRDSSENVETISQKSDDIDDDDDDDDDDTYMYEEDDTFVFDEESFLQAQFDEIANAPPGVEVSVSWFKEEDKAMEDSIKAAKEKEEEEKALAKFISFKNFDTVVDFSDHHFASKGGCSAKRIAKNWTKTIQREWNIMQTGLTDMIFVRVSEERMDLLRAAIIGAEGTPYHDGLFFFDVFFPSDYPNVPPQVHYHSGGLRLNPNLYTCGKVCLSLLNTWHGRNKSEKWTPGTSTMLQVLLSIQALVLNEQPVINEPGFEKYENSNVAVKYNDSTFILSCQTMLYSLHRPPKHFELLVEGHFRERARSILKACKAYIEGAQVGSLVEGMVPDAGKGDKDKSPAHPINNNYMGHHTAGGYFKEVNLQLDTGKVIGSLVPAFIKNGAKRCEEFIPLGDIYRTAKLVYDEKGQRICD